MHKYYNVDYKKSVLKFLVKHKDIWIKFYEKLIILQDNQYKNNLDIKRLKWSENKFRLRIWKYRFLYEVFEDVILIYFYDADGRWDVYK